MQERRGARSAAGTRLVTPQTASPTVVDPEARYVRALLERIRKGTCVLLMGPGVAIAPDDPTTPLTVRLSHELAQDPQINEDPRLGDRSNLRHVAQLHYQVKRDRDELRLAAEDFYGRFATVTTDFHRSMASLPFRLCISTTPDDLLLNAFTSIGKKPAKGYYNMYRASDGGLPKPSDDRPVVFHLYGHPSNRESLVLTESDLIEFLVRVVQREPPLPDVIRGHMGDPDTSFLFVGFGFQHWYVRVLLHVLNVYGHKDRSVALEDPAFFTNPEHAQTVGFFGDRAIEFKQFGWPELAERLKQMYAAQGETKPPAETESVAEGPRAFLSYASEDAEAVVRLSERLEAAGVGVWRDKQNLRGGDNWDRALVHVIEKQVNYVIVAQSKAMEHRGEGYFFKEIAVARQRQLRMRQDRIFVLPLQIEPCQGLDELKDLHQMSLATDEDFDKLVKVIREDWSKQQ